MPFPEASYSTQISHAAQRSHTHADSDCSICQEGYSNGRKVTLSCGHGFHSECIGTWFKQKTECPICRRFITKDESKSHGFEPVERTQNDYENELFDDDIVEGFNAYPSQSNVYDTRDTEPSNSCFFNWSGSYRCPMSQPYILFEELTRNYLASYFTMAAMLSSLYSHASTPTQHYVNPHYQHNYQQPAYLFQTMPTVWSQPSFYQPYSVVVVYC